MKTANNNMKQIIYFIAIVVLLTACKQNIKNEKTDEATEAVTQTPNVDSATTTPHQAQIAEQPKTKDELWNEYWTKFTDAIKQKDKEAMVDLSLKPNELSLDGYIFSDGGDTFTAKEFINYVDENGYWSDWLSIASNNKVKITKEKNRTIIDNYMIFEFIKGRWIWIGVMGD
ncbi:MAG: hypothetical protein U0T07_09560 [Chitinophagales bacterium]